MVPKLFPRLVPAEIDLRWQGQVAPARSRAFRPVLTRPRQRGLEALDDDSKPLSYYSLPAHATIFVDGEPGVAS